MLDEQPQSTDVAESPLGTAPESTGVAPSSVSDSGEQVQTAIVGDVTTQSVIEGDKVEQEGTTPPQPGEDDPLKDIPTSEELQQQVSQRVPYAAALLQLRTALEARNNELGEHKTTLQSLQPLLQQHGGAEAVQQRLEVFGKLFSPVINPDTQQPELDAHGFERTTTAPFVEWAEGENPGLAAQLAIDALNTVTDDGGQPTRLFQTPYIRANLLKAYGLDPERLEDYRNIDALSAATSNGQATQEQLETIPERFHEAFKSFNAEQRADLMLAGELAREGYLQDRAEALENKAFREQQAQTQREQQEQQYQAQLARVAQEQDSYVTTELQSAHAAIMDDLASQVTFSDDPKANAEMHAIVGAAVFALRDPDAAFIVEKLVDIKIDRPFYEALSAADKHLRDYKALDLMGQKGRAQASLTLATNAKNQVLAKISPVALRIAKALGATVSAKAQRRGELLHGATQTRPTISGRGGSDEGDGNGLPPGVLANSPEAGRILLQRAGLLTGG